MKQKRTRIIKLYLGKEEHENLRFLADLFNKTQSACLRDLINERYLKVTMPVHYDEV